MDLGAYANIDNLKEIAEKNGIDIPRLRGYRLMKDEKIISKEEIEQIKRAAAIAIAEDFCETISSWHLNSECGEWDDGYTDVKNYYLIENRFHTYSGIRWDRIHGKKRKMLKFEIKKKNRKIQQQYDMWNKYAGKENVLYIHSRMGGDNWTRYNKKTELMQQSWFLDRVDDYFDSTYCDFYARIN